MHHSPGSLVACGTCTPRIPNLEVSNQHPLQQVLRADNRGIPRGACFGDVQPRCLNFNFTVGQVRVDDTEFVNDTRGNHNFRGAKYFKRGFLKITYSQITEVSIRPVLFIVPLVRDHNYLQCPLTNEPKRV